jgi:alpha-amylase
MIQQLDYIQGMGFDAIWISPIVDNTDGGYHGYWARDWEAVNSNFGTKDDLK